MSRNLNDFKKEIEALSLCELHDPCLSEIQELIKCVENVCSEWNGHLCSEVEEKFSELEDLKDNT